MEKGNKNTAKGDDDGNGLRKICEKLRDRDEEKEEVLGISTLVVPK